MPDTEPSQRPQCPRLEWHDLTAMSRVEVAVEMAISLPWLALSWAATAHLHWAAGLPCPFYFFLCGLRQCHDCFHHNWPVPRWVSDATLAALSILMLGSMHAVRFNHLRHHADCLGPDDIEATSAQMTALRALAFGPRFPILLHRRAWRLAPPRQRHWIGAELALNAGWLAGVFLAWDSPALQVHAGAMALGQCLTAFFAVWTVHHDCAGALASARSLRCRWKSRLACDMFYHVEHHLYPRVPTRRLPELARRLDAALPGLRLPQVY